MRYEILMTLTTEINVFFDVMPCIFFIYLMVIVVAACKEKFDKSQWSWETTGKQGGCRGIVIIVTCIWWQFEMSGYQVHWRDQLFGIEKMQHSEVSG
jgi:hypothetical protein